MTRWYRHRTGEEAFYLDQDEIEVTMEAELEKARLFPNAAAPRVDVEILIERHLRASLDQYAELPESVLGMTEFPKTGSPRVLINRDLSHALDGEYAAPGTLGRLRATMAHEASHVILHRFLFVAGANQLGLPGLGMRKGETSEPQRCLKRNVGFSATGSDWKEIQANKGMAALLMPRRVFREVVAEEIARLQISRDDLEIRDPEVLRLARAVAGRFEVSCEAARIRLETLKLVRAVGEIPLDLK